MRTHTTRTLLTLVAVAALGPACWGHDEAAPAASTAAGSGSTGAVRDAKYIVCSVGYPEPSAAADSHLGLGDEIEIRKGKLITNVKFTVYNPARWTSIKEMLAAKGATRPVAARSELVPLLTCCGGDRLGGQMGFLHKEQRATHFVVIENTPASEGKPQGCVRDTPIITVKFCYPGRDDKGAEGWACEGRNPHQGDVHAQP
ncbi:MAG TPA: hypothetical protein VKB41_10375 [Steroidobacteraceae bacterium]|nr:hypothetical protein [Steroidobacteraceae bacterium]